MPQLVLLSAVAAGARQETGRGRLRRSVRAAAATASADQKSVTRLGIGTSLQAGTIAVRESSNERQAQGHENMRWTRARQELEES